MHFPCLSGWTFTRDRCRCHNIHDRGYPGPLRGYFKRVLASGRVGRHCSRPTSSYCRVVLCVWTALGEGHPYVGGEERDADVGYRDEEGGDDEDGIYDIIVVDAV